MRGAPHARLLSFALVIALGRVPADAQSPSIEASIRAEQARDAVRRGDIPDAIRLYRLSIELHPTPRVLRDFAVLLERAGDYRAAAQRWTQLATIDADAHERDAAIARSESLRRLPSLLRVWVLPGLAAREARVWFDHDVPRHVPVGGAEASVEGGAHRVRVESEGYVAFEVMVNVAYGEPMDVTARLERIPSGDRGGVIARDASSGP